MGLSELETENMSIDRNVHLYTEKSQPNPGEVMIRFGWKASEKSGKIAHLPRYVSAPELSFSGISVDPKNEDAGWIDFLNEAAGEFQRKLIHAYLTDALENDPNRGNSLLTMKVTVPGQFFDKTWLLDAWNEENEKTGTRGKLGAEAIKAYFDEWLSGVLLERIASKKGYTDETLDESGLKICEQAVNQYRALMMKLAENKGLEKSHILQAQKAMELVEGGLGPVRTKIMSRIQKLLNPVAKVELEELL